MEPPPGWRPLIRAAWVAGLLGILGCRDPVPSARDGAPGPAARGPRIVVEVLNASTRPGLARVTTQALRQAGAGQGIDVVFYGTADRAADTTLVLSRRGEPAAARRVAQALGMGVVRRQPDTLRRVDVTVILGRDFVLPRGLRP